MDGDDDGNGQENGTKTQKRLFHGFPHFIIYGKLFHSGFFWLLTHTQTHTMNEQN